VTEHRGAFRRNTCNLWIAEVLEKLEATWKRIEDVVIVCDYAPRHARLENALHNTGAKLLRLAPYSPPLNPIESVWSVLKSFVRRNLRIPQVVGFRVGEQRLQYLEEVVEEGLTSLNDQICVRASQHSCSFHGDVLALRDLRVGE